MTDLILLTNEQIARTMYIAKLAIAAKAVNAEQHRIESAQWLWIVDAMRGAMEQAAQVNVNPTDWRRACGWRPEEEG